jgi:hypothetical protein
MTSDQSIPAGSRQAIRLGNRDFEMERVRVPLTFLRLDPDNQRLSYLVKNRGGASETTLQELIWDMDPVKDLYTSIFQNGGLISDPIVRRDGTVVEGNCRTVCLRKLNERFPDDSRWQDVYVQVVPAEASDEQLTMLIGELHIAGKIEWRAFEQAEYVWKMNELFGKTIDFLASHLRMSRAKVQQKIAAYKATKAYIEETRDPDGLNRFSHFEEFAKKKELRDRLEADPGFGAQFQKWVHEGRFPDAKDVRDLPDILDNESAYNSFVNTGLTAAVAVLHDTDPSLLSSFWSTVDRAASELREAPLVEIEDLQSGHQAKLQKLKELRAALDTLASHAGVKLTA